MELTPILKPNFGNSQKLLSLKYGEQVSNQTVKNETKFKSNKEFSCMVY